MDPLSYLAQTEQQLSFIIAGGGRWGATKRDDSPTGLIKESDITAGGRTKRRSRRVSGAVKVLTDPDTACTSALNE